MNISQLINSTNSFGGNRTAKGTMSEKEFGDIYAGNKEVYYDPRTSSVSVSMYFGAKTQKNVSLHKSTVVLKNIEQQVYTRAEIAEYVRSKVGLDLYDKAKDFLAEQLNDNFKLSNKEVRQTYERLQESRKRFEAPYAFQEHDTDEDNNKRKVDSVKEGYDLINDPTFKKTEEYKRRYEELLQSVSEDFIIELILSDPYIVPSKFIVPLGKRTKKFVLLNKRISLSTEVQVKCSCADYYWTFAWANYNSKVHKGTKPPPYMNTYLRGYATRNPKDKPGLCKHLILFITILMQEGLVRERASMVNNFDIFSKINDWKIYTKENINLIINTRHNEK